MKVYQIIKVTGLGLVESPLVYHPTDLVFLDKNEAEETANKMFLMNTTEEERNSSWCGLFYKVQENEVQDTKIYKRKWIFLDICQNNLTSKGLENLKSILDNTGANIVIRDCDVLDIYNKKYINYKSIFNKTSYLHSKYIEIYDNKSKINGNNGNNISVYMMSNNIEDDNYLIISNNDDILYQQRNNFLQISKDSEISSQDVVNAISILNREF